MNNNFSKRIENIPSSIWMKINKIDELKGRWIAGLNLSPQILGRLKQSVLITSTGASTRIEGSKMSDENIEKMMRGISVQKFRERDSQEVKGYYELLQNVFNGWQTVKFNESTIKFFHKELLKYVEKDKRHRGEYKKQENRVEMFDEAENSLGVVFQTTSAYLTPVEMEKIINWTKDQLGSNTVHPLLLIGNFIVEFLNIHPFSDGNGRLSRILTNLLLLKSGYAHVPYVSHEKLVEDNKSDYYVALRKSQKTIKSKKENILPWLEFFFNALLSQIQKAVGLMNEENIEILLSEKQLSVWNYLHEVDVASPKEISGKIGIARPTVNQIVNKLIRLKKIKRMGEGKGTRYKVIK